MIRNWLAFSLVVVAAMISAIGCGTTEESIVGGETGNVVSDNGLIIGDTDESSLGVTPEVGIYKTTVTKGVVTETSFHLETEHPVTADLVVYVSYNSGGKDGEFIVIREGERQSEAFEFKIDDDEDIVSVAIAPHGDRIDVSLPKLAKNSERIEVTINYSFQKHPYEISSENGSVSK